MTFFTKIGVNDKAYPKRVADALGESAPNIEVLGDVGLLERRSVIILSRRAPSLMQCRYLERIGSIAGALELGVISPIDNRKVLVYTAPRSCMVAGGVWCMVRNGAIRPSDLSLFGKNIAWDRFCIIGIETKRTDPPSRWLDKLRFSVAMSRAVIILSEDKEWIYRRFVSLIPKSIMVPTWVAGPESLGEVVHGHLVLSTIRDVRSRLIEVARSD